MIDWNSAETLTLLNPRMPVDESNKIRQQLSEFSLKGHIWLTTSGTTGRYKCVALSKEAMLASADAVNHHFELTKDDRWLHCLPDFHVGGLGIYARAFLSGAEIVKIDSWDPSHFYLTAVACSATITAMVPAQLYDIVHLNKQAPESYRFTIIGGGVISKQMFVRSWELGWNAVPSYGMTECASQVATALPGSYDCYQPLRHVDLRIGPDQKIIIKSASLLTGYAFPGDENAEWQDPKVEGWFEAEDKGAFEQGILQVFGRGSDTIKINGELVNVMQLQLKIEDLRSQMNLNCPLFIIPVPHDRSGYALTLAVEGKASEIGKLIDGYNASVLPFERISDVKTVKKIPFSPLGKVKVDELFHLIN